MPHSSKHHTYRVATGFAFLLLVSTIVGCQGESGTTEAPPPPPPVVTVAHPVKKQAVEWDAYTGRFEAVEFVEVRPRVGGYLQSIHFDEGQIVKEGDLLFVIDPRPFEAELRVAEGDLEQAKAQLRRGNAQLKEAKAKRLQADAQFQLADSRRKRVRLLDQSNATSIEEVDLREAEYLQAEADIEASEATISLAEAEIATAASAIQSAKASVDAARLNLDYTRIHAPISGRISREYVTEGNLVSGGSDTSAPLTTITSTNPMYCTFDANEQDVLKYTRLAQSGERESSRVAKNPVYLGLTDEKGFPHQGHMDFVDNRFDVDTASIRARCVFPNEDGVLLPGMFARIRIPGSASGELVLIPDSAVGTDQSSQYVYVVENGVVQRRTVELGPIVDGLRVIRNGGLTGEEQLVIQGLLQIRPEMEVQTVDGTIQVVEDGLPDSYEPVPPDKWISPEPTPLPGANDKAQAATPAATEGGTDE